MGKKGGRPPKLDPVAVAADLASLNGNLAAVAKKHGVTRQAVQNLCRKNATLRDIRRDTREGMIDNAESSLYRAVLDGQAWAVCFFLKTQAKDRGYIERVADLPPLEVLLESLPPDVAATVRAALAKAVHDKRDSGGG